MCIMIVSVVGGGWWKKKEESVKTIRLPSQEINIRIKQQQQPK